MRLGERVRLGVCEREREGELVSESGKRGEQMKQWGELLPEFVSAAHVQRADCGCTSVYVIYIVYIV